MIKYNKLHLGLFCVLTIICISCESNILDKNIKDFVSTPIQIPIDKMEHKICSLFPDTVQTGKHYRIVNYIENQQCTDCVMSYYSNIENDKQYADIMKCVSMVYIIEVDSFTKEGVCADLIKERIKGQVYLDTCSSFITLNPKVAESRLFHTFVLNDSNNIVLLGDPFKNEQMVHLLRERITNVR